MGETDDIGIDEHLAAIGERFAALRKERDAAMQWSEMRARWLDEERAEAESNNSSALIAGLVVGSMVTALIALLLWLHP